MTHPLDPITSLGIKIEDKTDRVYKQLREVLIKKSKFYCGDIDIYKSFRTSENVLRIPIIKVILSRLLDKMSRIDTLLEISEDYTDDDEELDDIVNALDDSILDILGYAFILAIYFKDFKYRYNLREELDLAE